MIIGTRMTEALTYTQLGERLHVSAQAARALARRLRLPRQPANDGKTLVLVNLAEIAHKPKPATARSSDDDPAALAVLAAKVAALQAELATWSPRDDHAAMAVLKAQVGTLHAELIKAEAVAADHRANFAAERSRCDALIAELLRATADLMAAKEATAQLDGELVALRARRWWKRLAG
jgi:hypothetical protein